MEISIRVNKDGWITWLAGWFDAQMNMFWLIDRFGWMDMFGWVDELIWLDH